MGEPEQEPEPFPEDLFTPGQLREGAVVLHIIGCVYAFAGVVVATKEFLVPAALVMVEKIGCEADVGAAMAISFAIKIPDLCMAIIGMYLATPFHHLNRSIIWPSGFNLLFAFGFGCLFASPVHPGARHKLGWWQLLRELAFFVLALALATWSVAAGEKVEWWEVLVLFLIYAAYIGVISMDDKIRGLFYWRRRESEASVVGVSTHTHSTAFVVHLCHRCPMSMPRLYNVVAFLVNCFSLMSLSWVVRCSYTTYQYMY